MISITILGATGSVGVNTLAVLAHQRDRFRVIALTANRNVDRLYQQCLEWQPQYAVLRDPDAAEQLAQRLNKASAEVTVLAEAEGLQRVASLPQVDYVMAAIVGAAGFTG